MLASYQTGESSKRKKLFALVTVALAAVALVLLVSEGVAPATEEVLVESSTAAAAHEPWSANELRLSKRVSEGEGVIGAEQGAHRPVKVSEQSQAEAEATLNALATWDNLDAVITGHATGSGSQDSADAEQYASGVSERDFEEAAFKDLPKVAVHTYASGGSIDSIEEGVQEKAAVDKASHAAVHAAINSTLKEFEEQPISAFGDVAKNATSDSFKHAYTQQRLRLSGLAPLEKDMGAHGEKAKAFSAGDLPVPPPLASKDGKPIPWPVRLQWAQGNCVKVRSAAESKCSSAHHAAKAACAATGDSVDQAKPCAELLATARNTCHKEHHQAYKTCNALWHTAHSQPAKGESLQVEPLIVTRLDKQLHAAQVQCEKKYEAQQSKCQVAHNGAHLKCHELQAGVESAVDPKAAFHAAQLGCQAANKQATDLCASTQKDTQADCDLAWSTAKQVASPMLAEAMHQQGGQYMANATKTCLTARKRVLSLCHDAQIAAYKACGAKISKAPLCQSKIKEGQDMCSSTHQTAHSACLAAFQVAQAQNEALVQAVSSSAENTATMVASQAKTLGLDRDLAERAARKAAQAAMLATARGESPTPLQQEHTNALHTARAAIHAKMKKVVADVRKVWKAKITDAIKSAASSAAVQARKDGKSAVDARKAAIGAAEAASTKLQHMAYEAELKAAAKATGPEIAKLVASTAEKDRRKFEALARPYQARADKLMQEMNAAEAKVEAAQEKNKKKEEAAAASKQAKENRVKAKERRVKTAGARVAATTEAAANAGEKVSQELADIARMAKEAADEAEHTVVEAEAPVDVVPDQLA